eukprot:m.261364 g.261364  ORF g.261364 m.261364 type:complete len:444 (+) comp42017_c0_seq1:349-1680(+)
MLSVSCNNIGLQVCGMLIAPGMRWDLPRKKQKAKGTKDVVLSKADLDAAFPFPWAFLLGWAIFGVSYLFDPKGGFDTTLQLTSPNLLALVFSLALGVIASVPMGDAVKNRKATQKKILGLMFVLSWIGLSIFSSYIESGTDWSFRNGNLSIALCLIGAFTIIASMKILWKHRKMGDDWEQHAKPNPNPVVYNMGGPMFVFGWFVFWLGMASVNLDQDQTATYANCDKASLITCGFPVYWNLRTFLSFFSGCGMVPVVMMLDYAHDEGSEFVGFGTSGKYFGRFFESPVPFVLFWVIFGLANFVKVDNTFYTTASTRCVVVLALCVAQGIDAGVLIQTALYKGDMAKKNFYSVFFVLMFISLGVSLGYTPGFATHTNYITTVCGVLGAILVIAGQKTVFGDRKRGDYFMQNNGKVNPNPVVYSAGEPLFMLGWILLCIANSIDF